MLAADSLVWVAHFMHQTCMQEPQPANVVSVVLWKLSRAPRNMPTGQLQYRRMVVGVAPLGLLHVEEVLVLLVSLLSAEENRRQHARIEGDTVDDARVAGLSGGQQVHGALQAGEADVSWADRGSWCWGRRGWQTRTRCRSACWS